MRKRDQKIARRGRCPVIWGSHACRKQNDHRGRCRCNPGCVLGPTDEQRAVRPETYWRPERAWWSVERQEWVTGEALPR